MSKNTSLNPTEILWEEVIAGKVNAYEQLFNLFYEDLVRYTHRYTQQQVISEEIIQEVFISLWERRMEVKITTSLKAYLYRAAKNRTINYLKLQLPKDQATYDINEQTGLTVETTIEDNSENLKKALNQAIQTLPEKCRAIFLLSRNEGLTYKEIAEELAISTKTVENQIGIAIKKLKIELSPYLGVNLILVTLGIVSNVFWG